MKRILFTVLICSLMAFSTAFAQDKYFTKTGTITFFSAAPLENIEAANNNATSVLDAKTGRMEFAVLMKAFRFEKALMEEHFNENYVESDKYPKATFAGTITNFSTVDLSRSGTYNVIVKGKLTLHGVTNEIEAPGTLTVENGKIKASSVFNLAPEDYQIKIPRLVREKIAKQVKVTVQLDYQPLKS